MVGCAANVCVSGFAGETATGSQQSRDFLGEFVGWSRWLRAIRLRQFFLIRGRLHIKITKTKTRGTMGTPGTRVTTGTRVFTFIFDTILCEFLFSMLIDVEAPPPAFQQMACCQVVKLQGSVFFPNSSLFWNRTWSSRA